ncbi:hypothetical protein TNCV_3587211 [Trichonephila clavipes]|nr:hypothetical protein TNCV_3587211 [Trichonephila clavipes]
MASSSLDHGSNIQGPLPIALVLLSSVKLINTDSFPEGGPEITTVCKSMELNKEWKEGFRELHRKKRMTLLAIALSDTHSSDATASAYGVVSSSVSLPIAIHT